VYIGKSSQVTDTRVMSFSGYLASPYLGGSAHTTCTYNTICNKPRWT